MKMKQFFPLLAWLGAMTEHLVESTLGGILPETPKKSKPGHRKKGAAKYARAKRLTPAPRPRQEHRVFTGR